MSRRCIITGKGPLTGNRVSHSNRKSKTRSLPNIQERRFWLPSERRFVKLTLSAKGIRIVDKRGIERVVADLRRAGHRV